jgi:ribosomal protein L16 Arg81 hydroxylase
LSRLISRPADEFAESYWGSEPLLSRAAELPASFSDLFSNDAVDELVSERGLRTPFLRLARNGTTLPDRSFTSGGGIGAGITDQLSDDRLLRQFAEGATMVLQGLHRTWKPVITFSQDLSADLGHPVQVNAYVTPAQSTGFSDHYDVHDVFVLQVEGRKQWRIRPPVHPLPLRDQPWTDHRQAVEQATTRQPLIETVLEPGDCLYLPRGYLHSATALGEVSTHLTIGIHPWTRQHLAEEVLHVALTRAAEDVALRRSLPLGVDAADAGQWAGDLELVRAALLRAVGEIDPTDLEAALTRRVRSAQRAAPVRPLAQVRAAERLRPDQQLVLRPHLTARLAQVHSGYAVLSGRAGEAKVAEADVAAVQQLLDEGSATVSRLGEELARQLLLQGVVVPG